MGQTTRSTPASPWRKAHEGVRVMKLKCERGGHGERRFRAYCITDKDSKEVQAVVSAFDVEQAFESWHNFKAMPTDQEFEFPADDKPTAIINYRKSNQHELTDVKTDETYYLSVFRDMLTEAGIYAGNYTPDARKAIVNSPTLVDAIVWAKQYIEANQKTGKKALEEHFGPKPTEPLWIDNPKDRSMFWGDIHACGNQYQVWLEMSVDETTAFVHQVIGSKLHETTLTRPEATKKVIDAINAEYGDKEQSVVDQTTVEITKEQWLEWLKENELEREYVVGLMNSDSIERGQGPVRGLTEWDKDIPAATALILKDRAAKAEKEKQAQKSTQSHQTAPTTNGTKATPSTPPKSETKPTVSKFKKAEQKNSKLRMLIGGISGGGKTYTALQIARTLYPDGKVALIDTESGSAEKFAHKFSFDVMELSDYQPEAYISAIHEAEADGYDVLIIDSMTHEWQGIGGVLDIVEDLKSKYKTSDGKQDTRAAWREMSPRHQALIDTILKSKMHIIATVRAKIKEVVERTEDKKAAAKKVVLDFIQRGGLEYEFDIVLRAHDIEHRFTVDKSRCTDLDGYKGIKCGVEIAHKIAKWLNIELSESEMATAS